MPLEPVHAAGYIEAIAVATLALAVLAVLRYPELAARAAIEATLSLDEIAALL